MNRLFRSKIFSALLAVPILGLALALISLKNQQQLVMQDYNNIHLKVGKIDKSNEYLQKLLNYSDRAALLEREVKLRLNLKSADEEVALVYRDMNSQASISPATAQKPRELPNWKKWWYYVLGINKRD